MKKIYVEELQAIAYLTMYEGLNKEILKAKVDPFVINHITKRLISAEEKLKSICNLKTSTAIDKEAIEIANAHFKDWSGGAVNYFEEDYN